jgi:creatinine amidohydrolase
MHKYRYDELTWPEMNEAIGRQAAVLLPFGTVEDHGRHLPLNTDNVIVEGICLEVARRAAGEILVMPLVSYGLVEHHMDFPGTVSVAMEILLAYLTDVAISVARHGYTHVLIENGHVNAPLADLVARKVVLKQDHCARWPNAAIDPHPVRAGTVTDAPLCPGA